MHSIFLQVCVQGCGAVLLLGCSTRSEVARVAVLVLHPRQRYTDWPVQWLTTSRLTAWSLTLWMTGWLAAVTSASFSVVCCTAIDCETTIHMLMSLRA